MLARFFVALYFFVHGKLRLPGSGWLIRKLAPYNPDLQAFPLVIPGVGTAIIDCRDEAVFALLNFSLGEYGNDQALLTLMSRELKPGHVLWDVGANIGYLAQYFARPEFRLAAIHSFEPNPAALKVLRTMFCGHAHVRIHPFGLGAVKEQRQLFVYEHSSPVGSIVRDLPGAAPVQISIFPADTSLLENEIAPPDIIKIDVEGFEPQVFAGMQQTIREKRPIIFFEHLLLEDETVRQLVPPEYELFFLLDDGTLTRDFGIRRQGANGVLVPFEKLHSFMAASPCPKVQTG